MVFGCEKAETNLTEKRIAIKVVNQILEKNSINKTNFSNEVFIHVKSINSKKGRYKTRVSINSLKPESNAVKRDSVNISGFTVFIYYDKPKNKSQLPAAFFVPDARSWNFSTEIVKNEIIITELKLETNKNVNHIEESNEFDNF